MTEDQCEANYKSVSRAEEKGGSRGDTGQSWGQTGKLSGDVTEACVHMPSHTQAESARLLWELDRSLSFIQKGGLIVN